MGEGAGEQTVVTEPESVRVPEQSQGPDQPQEPQQPRSRWRRWGVRLAIVMCTGWLVFVVLHRILSGRVYWWGPIDLLPPLIFAAVPVALLVVAQLARPVRWRLTAVTMIGLLLGVGYSGINVATLWYTPPLAPDRAITVVSWNTQYWDQDQQKKGGPHTTADFYRYLRGLNADVYELQEYAHVDTTLKDVFAQALAIDQEAQLRQTFPGYTIVVAGRDITLSRFPVVGHHWLDNTPYMPADLKAVPPGLSNRPLFYESQTLRTDINVNGKIVSFYNSHFYQPPVRMMLLRSDPDRSMFAIDRFNKDIRDAGYRAVTADMAKNPNPKLLAGDFNTSPSMGLLRKLPDQLVDQTRALTSIYPVTWSIGSPLHLWRLDWLFTTHDIAVHSYKLLDPQGLSDHKAQKMVISTS